MPAAKGRAAHALRSDQSGPKPLHCTVARMVAIMAESGRDFYHVFIHDHKPASDSMNDTEVIDRVPVIHINILKCEKKEAHSELTTSHSDATTDQCDTIVRNTVHKEVSDTVSDANNVTNYISSSMLGVLFPHNPSDIQAFSQ